MQATHPSGGHFNLAIRSWGWGLLNHPDHVGSIRQGGNINHHIFHNRLQPRYYYLLVCAK